MPTVSEVLASFQRNVQASKTTMEHRTRIYGMIGQVQGTKPVEECRLIDLLDWVNSVPTWGAGMKDLAVRTINAGLNWGVRVGLIQSNPFANVEMETPEQGRAWSEEEYQRMLNAASNPQCVHFKEFMKFMRETGARPGEVAGADWKNWKESTPDRLVLPDHKTRRKTKKPRIIPLSFQAQQIIRYQRGRCGVGKIFRTGRGVDWTRSKLSLKTTEVRTLAGLPDDVVLHGIRHLFATDWVKKGGNIAILSKVLGHSSIETTLRCYVHLAYDDVDMMLAEMKAIK